MWQLEIVRMRGDTEPRHPQPRPVIQSDCQSLFEIPTLFTLVLLTCVSVHICVCVPVFILRQWIWEKWQCGLALCQSPSKVACVSALLTDALILLAIDGGCKCGTCLVTEQHSLHDNSARRQDTSSQVWCERVTAEGPGSQRVSESCSDLCTAGDAATMPHLTYSLLFLNGCKRNLFLSGMDWHGSSMCHVWHVNMNKSSPNSFWDSVNKQVNHWEDLQPGPHG